MTPRLSVPSTTALLFDIDGTLVDSTYHHALAWHRAFADVGAIQPMYRLHRAIGMGGDKLVAHVAGQDVEDSHGDRLRARWRKEYEARKAEVQPLRGASELIEQAADDGFQVALASSGEPDLAHEVVDLLGIRRRISALTTSADVEDSKPEPDLVGTTLDMLDDVTHAVLVGDTPYDVEAARRAGISCIALLSGGFSEAELRGAGAVLVVQLPHDLLDIDWRGVCGPVSR